jgi:TLD
MTRNHRQQQQQQHRDDDDDEEEEEPQFSPTKHHDHQPTNHGRGPLCKQRIRIDRNKQQHELILQQQQQLQRLLIVQEEQEVGFLHHEPLTNLVGDVGATLFAPLDLSRLVRSSSSSSRSTPTAPISSTGSTDNNNSMIIKPFSAAYHNTLSDRSSTTTAGFTASTMTTMESSSSSWSLLSERTTPVPLTTTPSNTAPPAHFYRVFAQEGQSAAILTSQMTTATEEEGEEQEQHEEEESASSDHGGSEPEDDENDDKVDEVDENESRPAAAAAYPVELQWEDASNLVSCPRILTPAMMQQLHDEGLPESLQMNAWERCFAIGRDGDCFVTLLDYCAPYTQTLICLRTTRGHVLGGFVSHPWRSQEGYGNRHAYYGSSGGVSFLFCSHPGPTTGCCGSSSSSSSSSTIPEPDTSKELQIYKWTGSNDYCQICNVDQAKLAMGGHGDFGLIVEDNFWHGQTGHCSTYNNPPLIPATNSDNENNDDLNNSSSSGGDGFFEVEAFEIYGLVPYIQSFVPTPTSASDNKQDLFKKTITDTKGSRWIRTALHGS